MSHACASKIDFENAMLCFFRGGGFPNSFPPTRPHRTKKIKRTSLAWVVKGNIVRTGRERGGQRAYVDFQEGSRMVKSILKTCFRCERHARTI